MNDEQETRRERFRRRGAHVDGLAIIGDGTLIWGGASLQRDARIGNNCVVGQGAHIGKNVVVGNGCKIQNGAQLFEGVTLEDDVFVGPHAVFTNVTIPRAFINRKAEFKPTLVKRGASIGANVTILCGVTIGEYAMIGAGAVVTKDVPAYTLVVGTPAGYVGRVCQCGTRLGMSRHSPPADYPYYVGFACPGCPRRYRAAYKGQDSEALVLEPLDAP